MSGKMMVRSRKLANPYSWGTGLRLQYTLSLTVLIEAATISLENMDDPSIAAGAHRTSFSRTILIVGFGVDLDL